MEPVVELRPGFLAAAVRQHWRLVVGCGIAGLLVVAGLIQLKGPSYTATAVVLVNPLAGNPYSPTTSSLRNEQLNSLETEAALVTTQAVTKRAIANSGGALSETAGNQVSVKVVPAATVLRISFAGSSAAKASTGAQSFADAFLNYRQAQAEAAIKRQVDGIDAEMAEINTALTQVRQQLTDATTAERALLDSQLTVYASQWAQLQTEKVTAKNSAKNPGQVITPATVPTAPDGLPRWLLLVGGLIAGLAVGVMICLWREHNDDRVREPEDVSALGLPRMLAVVPPTAGRSMFDVSSSEGFQLLRSSVLARLPRQSAVISICPVGTANRSGEFGFALAAALERSGRRIVLVLGQTGQTNPYVWVPAGPGLTDMLLNPGLGEHVDELLHRLSDNLWVLPPGRVLRDVADVFQSPVMGDLIRQLRGVADIVLVAAPDLSTAAGRALAGVGDTVLLMIGMAETRHGTLMDAYDELAFRDIGVIGVVGVTRRRRRREPKPAKSAEIALGTRLATRPAELRPAELRPPAPAEAAPAPTAPSTTGIPDHPEPVRPERNQLNPEEQPVQLVPPPQTMQPPRRPPLLRPAQPNGPPAKGAGESVTAAAPGEAEPAPGAKATASTDAPTMRLPKLTGKPDESAEPAQTAAEPAPDQSTDGEPARSDGGQSRSGGKEEPGGTRPGASSGRAETPVTTPPR